LCVLRLTNGDSTSETKPCEPFNTAERIK
jgi:hypothetical protein